MRCRTCGNEVSAEEAFCGQCGTPVNVPQAQQTEMMHGPSPRSGHLNGYAPNGNIGAPNNLRAGTRPLSPPGASLSPVPARPQPQTPQFPQGQDTGFYRDATEAISVAPAQPGYPPSYGAPLPSQAYPPPSNPTSYGFSGQGVPPAHGQPLQSGNYAGQGYPPPQGYRAVPTPPKSQRNGAVIFIVSMCLVVALLSVVGVGTLYVLKGRNAPPTGAQAPLPTATTVPTDVPTPTPTLVPTDTVAPTPTEAPVAGFAYCGTLCTSNGFSTQYPQAWGASPLTGTQGVQFVNPNPGDEMAIFKTPGTVAGGADALVTNNVMQNYAMKNNFEVVTPAATDSIGGETWFKRVITYQGDEQQQERVEVYGTVHQGKAYILELQASSDQFEDVATQYFATIKSQFQFQP